MTRDRISALMLLGFSVVYGWMSTGIQMFPGAEADPFTPQTLPRALAFAGAALAVAIFLFPSGDNGRKSFPSAFAGLDWGKALALLVLMVMFALGLEWLGFIVATSLFLVGGFFILGIRRPMTLALGSLPLAVGFWLVLTQALGIYLAPGELWFRLGIP